jgi:hypothetical protein
MDRLLRLSDNAAARRQAQTGVGPPAGGAAPAEAEAPVAILVPQPVWPQALAATAQACRGTGTGHY